MQNIHRRHERRMIIQPLRGGMANNTNQIVLLGQVGRPIIIGLIQELVRRDGASLTAPPETRAIRKLVGIDEQNGRMAGAISNWQKGKNRQSRKDEI